MKFFLTVVVLAGLALSAASHDTSSTSNSLPGRSCGSKQCIKPDAICEDEAQGICECKGNKEGDGYLYCNNPNHDVCVIIRASTVTNFNPGSKPYRLVVPCRYVATTFTTRKDERPVVGCSVTIHALGERVWGRFWSRGFEASIITERDGTSEYAAYRVRGTREENVYEYRMEKKKGPDDFWYSVPSVDEPTVQLYVDDVNQRALLDVTHCGLHVVYRPELASEGKFQTVEPGLVISVDRRAVDITWPSSDEGVCLTPTSVSGGDTSQDKAKELGLTKPHAMNYIAFTNSEKSLHPTAPCDCEDVSKSLERCTNKNRRGTAFDRCMFIMDNPPFVTCMESRGHDASTVMSLFSLCVDSFCQNNSAKCRRVQSGIRDKGCEEEAEAQFMNFNCNTIA